MNDPDGRRDGADRDPLAELAAIVGPRHLLTEAADIAPYAIDERRLFHGRPRAVVRPASTAEVAAVVRCCHAARLAMVPHGGNTGYCGGATADTSGRAIVISMARLDRVLDVDAAGFTLTVQAGVTLARAQAAAAAEGLLLPLAMGSQGSCQLGGNLSTNAGGLAVLRYGTARDLVLGLEVVLPDGSVCDRLSRLRKDNTGYDLKQLFIGAEGTLGIITGAVLKLHAAAPVATAWLAVRDVAAACALLGRLRRASADNVTSFEYMGHDALQGVARALPHLALPLGTAAAHQVLVECTALGAERLAEVLAEAAAAGLVEDAIIARGGTEQRALWQVRESIPAAERAQGGSIKHDVSVPIASLAEYIGDARARIAADWPRARLSVYGHIGDGNVHFNVLAPADGDAAAFRATHGDGISDSLHDLAHAFGGSFSAEHGVGQLKRDLLARYADDVSLDLMRALKRALDPLDLMNPGKLIPWPGASSAGHAGPGN